VIRVLCGLGDSGPKTSWVKISQIRTLSVERLGRRIGALGAEEVDRVIEGLFELVG
jgi:mRNA interferase MazF